MNLKHLHSNCITFTLYALTLLLATRLIIFFYFGSDQALEVEVLREIFFMGLRFDLKLISVLLLIFAYLPALFFNLTKSKLLFRWLPSIFFALFIVLLIFSFIEFGYYLFFGNGIDLLIFGLVDDGTVAVMESLQGDWRLVSLTIASIGIIIISFLLFKMRPTVSGPASKGSIFINTLHTFLVILLLAIIARGSFGTFPLSRKTITTSENSFSTALIFNPVWHMYYAYKDKQENDFSTSSNKILSLAGVKTVDELEGQAGYSDTNPLWRHTSNNPLLEKNPPNIVFVLMEGWSSHIALMHSEGNNVLGEFSSHSESDHFFTSFFSNAYGTNPTIESLLLNSPIKGISQSKAMRTSFSLSAIKPFKKAGYDVTFMSGGSSSWRNHNQFWPLQGFDKYIGRSSIETFYNVKSDNPWGVYEEHLFSYLKKELIEQNDTNRPTFTFVVTTNNHPPVKLPANFSAPAFDLAAMKINTGDTLRKEMLAGYYYQSDQLGKFLSWIKASPLRDNTIVVATGDHILKGFDDYLAPRQQFLKYAVPFYAYIPKALDTLKTAPKDLVGSHEDIFPTLYELALSGEGYYAFGSPLMFNVADRSGWNEQDRYLFKEVWLLAAISYIHGRKKTHST